MTCATNKQCKLVDTGRIELGCVITVNGIGKSLVDKLDKLPKSPMCEEKIDDVIAECHRNTCSIK